MKNIVHIHSILNNQIPIKVLYFQNNEVLNYLSFYASSLGSTIQILPRIVNYNSATTFYKLNATTQYFIRVQLNPDDEKLIIETKTSGYDNADYSIGGAFFSQKLTDDELTNEDNYFSTNLVFDSTYLSNYETRKFKNIKNNVKATYMGILMNNGYHDLRSFEIIVRPDNSLPNWVVILISVVAFIIISVFLFFCLRTEGGRAACLCVLGICLICCSNSGRRH